MFGVIIESTLARLFHRKSSRNIQHRVCLRARAALSFVVGSVTGFSGNRSMRSPKIDRIHSIHCCCVDAYLNNSYFTNRQSHTILYHSSCIIIAFGKCAADASRDKNKQEIHTCSNNRKEHDAWDVRKSFRTIIKTQNEIPKKCMEEKKGNWLKCNLKRTAKQKWNILAH